MAIYKGCLRMEKFSNFAKMEHSYSLVIVDKFSMFQYIKMWESLSLRQIG